MKSHTQRPVTRARVGRWRDVAAITGLGHSAIYRVMQTDPSFPKPFRLVEGGRSVGWELNLVERWAEQRIKKGSIHWPSNPARAAAKKARSARRKSRSRARATS